MRIPISRVIYSTACQEGSGAQETSPQSHAPSGPCFLPIKTHIYGTLAPGRSERVSGRQRTGLSRSRRLRRHGLRGAFHTADAAGAAPDLDVKLCAKRVGFFESLQIVGAFADFGRARTSLIVQKTEPIACHGGLCSRLAECAILDYCRRARIMPLVGAARDCPWIVRPARPCRSRLVVSSPPKSNNRYSSVHCGADRQHDRGFRCGRLQFRSKRLSDVAANGITEEDNTVRCCPNGTNN